MRPPIFVRALSEAERERLEAGLRSPDAYVLRRCQILLASARGEWVPRIAEVRGCDDQAVRNVIREFERDGLDACLKRGSTRPHTTHAKVDTVATERLRALLHRGPRAFGQPTGVWTLELAAEAAFAEGITAEPVSDEVWLRFVDGRPVSPVTVDYLDWCCRKLHAAGKEALRLIWDNAAWHASQQVRAWIRDRNRRVERRGQGVRIIACYLPSKSPWLNAIEAVWVHGKRRVVEADRLLTSDELAARVCDAYGCPHEPHLAFPEQAA
jgi:transposase